MYYLERRAIKAFNTRYPAGYNLDAGGLIPEHHPMSVEKTLRPTQPGYNANAPNFVPTMASARHSFSTTSASNRVVQEGG